MVVSKRCKICTVLDADNIPISGEYFGKLLPDLIVKISGIELDPRKANGVLICQSCAIQLIHTGTIVDKLRNTLQRLKKLEARTKTPSKISTASQVKTANTKESSTNNAELQNTDRSETGEVVDLDESKPQNDIKSKTPKKVIRRKSVYPDENQIKNDEDSKEDKETANSEKSDVDGNDFQKNTQESKTQNKTIRKTPKPAVRRKSVFPDDKDKVVRDEKSAQNGEISNSEKSESGEIDSQTNSEESNIQSQSKTKSPKKAVSRKSILPDDKQSKDNAEESQQNGETPNTVGGTTKFKKIMDSDFITPTKKTPKKATKRKLVTSTDETLNSTTSNPSPMKRNKTMSSSISEESPINCAIDEQDGTISNNKAKVMNCIICGKAFNEKGSLRDHIETSHMGERLKACPHCSSEFRSQQKYESHVFSEKCKNAKHACQYPKCNKRFKTVHKMELHMQEKHSSQNEQEAE